MRISLLYPQGKEKALTLSYDDGVDTDIRFIELLEKYNIKCTFNINAGLFTREGAKREEGQIHFRLPKSEILRLYDNPRVEVATHGYSHPRFQLLPTAQCVTEIVEDRKELERMFGKIIRGHAYPFGTYNDKTIEVLGNAGIVYARTVMSTHNFLLPENWLTLHPTCHHADAKLPELTERFLNGGIGENDGWLFYLWGHTYEFRRDNNWNVIEEFFEKVSGNDNIWYATNIEVYDYVTAYKRLQFSLDADIIHNPSSIDVWIRLNGETVHIPAGKTVKV